MVKTLLQKTMLLCALLLMGMNVGAKEITYDFTASIPSGWTASKSPLGYETTGDYTRGAQFNESSTLTLSGVKNVSKVVITCSTNVASKNSLAVSVNGTKWNEVTLPKNNNMTQTFEGKAASGNLVVTITRAEKSVYIKTIVITADDSSTGGEDSGETGSETSLNPDYDYAEPTTVGPSGATCNNVSYSFIQNNIEVKATAGGQAANYFGCNASASLTFTATKEIKAVVVDGFLKKGFEATASSGEIAYADASEDTISGSPVLVVLNVNSKSLTLKCEKQLRCYKVHFYFEGNPDVEIETGGSSDYNFDWEPATAQTLNITFDKLYETDYSESAGVDLTDLYFVSEDYEMDLYVFAPKDATCGIAPGTYEINSTNEPGTVMASPGGNDEEDVPSFIAADFEYDEDYGSWYYNKSYYLVSGTLKVEKTADGGVTYTLNAKTAKGSTVNATYTGIVQSLDEEGDDDEEEEEETELTYEWEPTTATTKNIVFDELMETDYSDYVGYNLTDLLFASDDYEMELYVYVPKDAECGIAPGTYVINDSGEDGTVQASPGGDDNEDYPSFIAADFAYEEDYGYYYSTAYYLVSGTLKVEKTSTGVKYTLDAKTYYGSTIKATFEGVVQSMDKDEEEDAIKSTEQENAAPSKLLKNGRIIIQRDGKEYTTSGVRIK